MHSKGERANSSNSLSGRRLQEGEGIAKKDICRLFTEFYVEFVGLVREHGPTTIFQAVSFHGGNYNYFCTDVLLCPRGCADCELGWWLAGAAFRVLDLSFFEVQVVTVVVQQW